MPLLLQKFIVNQQAVTPQHSLINNMVTNACLLRHQQLEIEITRLSPMLALVPQHHAGPVQQGALVLREHEDRRTAGGDEAEE